MRKLALASLLAAFLLGGCAHATIRKAQSLETAPPRTVAVMPTEPGGAPPEAGLLTRDLVREYLSRQGYQVIQFAELDKRVAPDAAASDVFSAIEADAVMYTRVTQYDVESTFFNTRTSFGVNFEMLAPDGRELWIAAWTSAADTQTTSEESKGVGKVLGAAYDAAKAHGARKAPPFAAVARDAVARSIGELPEGPLAK